MRMVDFVAEQNRLNRTRGLKRTDPGGEIEPSDYPLSALEAEWFRRTPEEQIAMIEEVWALQDEQNKLKD